MVWTENIDGHLPLVDISGPSQAGGLHWVILAYDAVWTETIDRHLPSVDTFLVLTKCKGCQDSVILVQDQHTMDGHL